MVTQSSEEVAKQIKCLHEFYRSPSKKGKEVVEKMHEAGSQDDGSDESEDSDYMPGDASSSEEDDEAAEIMRRFKTFKKKQKKGEMAKIDDVVLGNQSPKAGVSEAESEGYGTPHCDLDDEDSFEEIDSDGEVRKKKDHYRRFNCSDDVPKFELGMKFSGKKEFKDAVIRYCLHERKVVIFIKDISIRVRAKCDW